ncbi:MAG: DUF952 domain-containing protein [Pseudomonadota bacterium]
MIRDHDTTTVFHIAVRAEWDADAGGLTYVPAAFANEGFIHWSYAAQLVATARRYYQGREDLILLRASRAALAAHLVDENLLGGTELFPHLYAPLLRSDVIETAAIAWLKNGEPEFLRGYLDNQVT